MKRQTDQIIDYFTTHELSQALTTLNALSLKHPSFQISFNHQHPALPFTHPQPHNSIQEHHHYFGSFQKGGDKSNPIRSRMRHSPLKQKTHNVLQRQSNVKSRSVSPFDRKTERTYSRVTNYSKHANSHKENKKKTVPIRPSSNKNKQILNKRQKCGINYIPIQHRAEDLLREKERKIVQKQKLKEVTKILEEKECTFKPQIKKYYKKTKSHESQDHLISDEDKRRFQQCFIDQVIESQEIPFREDDMRQTLCSKGRGGSRQYKNEKFNYLLDLIQ